MKHLVKVTFIFNSRCKELIKLGINYWEIHISCLGNNADLWSIINLLSLYKYVNINVPWIFSPRCIENTVCVCICKISLIYEL